MPTYVPSYDYNIFPEPRTGSTPYGQVPGPIGIPPSEYQQVSGVYPDLGAQAQIAGQNIGAGLMGELDPATLFQLQRNAARFGVQTGMPLSGLQTTMGLSGLQQTIEQRQAQALQQYESLAKSLGSMMTPQALASEIAARNATMAAAPDPELAAEQQMADWMTKFRESGAAARGGGGISFPTAGFDREGVSDQYGVRSPYALRSSAAYGDYQPSADYLSSLYAQLPTGRTIGGGPDRTIDEMIASAADPWGAFFSTGEIPSEGITTGDWMEDPYALTAEDMAEFPFTSDQ